MESSHSQQEMAERLRLIYAGAKVGTWVWEFSDGSCETFGTTEALWGRNDLRTGMDFVNAIHPEDKPEVIRQVELALADPTAVYDPEFRVVWPDGTVRWINAPGTVFRDKDGRPVRMAGINRDITAQKEAEIALAATNRTLQLTAERVQLALAAGAIIGTWVWDLPHDRFTVDEGFAFSFGIDPERGRSGLSLEEVISTVHPDDLAGLRAAIAEAVSRGGAYSHEYRVCGSDGVYRWIEANGRVELAPDGTPVRFPGVLRDVSERKASELAMREIEARNRLFIENAPAAIAMFDREMRYIAASRRWLADRRMPSDVVGRSHYSFFPATPAHWREVHRRGLAGESLAMEREEVQRADGTTQWIKWELRPWHDANGDIGGIMLATEDITAAVQAEEALRKNEKLAVVGRLAAAISHEINNPLEAVFNLLYLCRDFPLPAAADAYLARAEEELKRVSHVVTHTLVFNRQSTRESREKISELVESALAIYEGRLKQIGIHVVEQYQETERVLCMSSELRQVFANLIGNAFDAMTPGGTLRVRTRDLRHPRTGQAGVRVTIADSGTGMNPQTMLRVGEPFFTTKGMQGTGLGLWVSRDILHKHRGRLAVRSRSGVGSVFSIWLPTEGVVS